MCWGCGGGGGHPFWLLQWDITFVELSSFALFCDSA